MDTSRDSTPTRRKAKPLTTVTLPIDDYLDQPPRIKMENIGAMSWLKRINKVLKILGPFLPHLAHKRIGERDVLLGRRDVSGEAPLFPDPPNLLWASVPDILNDAGVLAICPLDLDKVPVKDESKWTDGKYEDEYLMYTVKGGHWIKLSRSMHKGNDKYETTGSVVYGVSILPVQEELLPRLQDWRFGFLIIHALRAHLREAISLREHQLDRLRYASEELWDAIKRIKGF